MFLIYVYSLRMRENENCAITLGQWARNGYRVYLVRCWYIFTLAWTSKLQWSCNLLNVWSSVHVHSWPVIGLAHELRKWFHSKSLSRVSLNATLQLSSVHSCGTTLPDNVTSRRGYKRVSLQIPRVKLESIWIALGSSTEVYVVLWPPRGVPLSTAKVHQPSDLSLASCHKLAHYRACGDSRLMRIRGEGR